uniref:Uncharacterized protein n=1 Tax=Anguilla anguilla TaxID=7936 RepID=A0A0E9WF05_ANGAN
MRTNYLHLNSQYFIPPLRTSKVLYIGCGGIGLWVYILL